VRLTPAGLVALWNAGAASNLPRAVVCTPERLRAARARLREYPARATWDEVIAKVNASPFLLGDNDRGWRASLDFLLRPGRVGRVLEGTYDDARAQRAQEIEAELLAEERARR
jgi:hypothetical protein